MSLRFSVLQKLASFERGTQLMNDQSVSDLTEVENNQSDNNQNIEMFDFIAFFDDLLQHILLQLMAIYVRLQFSLSPDRADAEEEEAAADETQNPKKWKNFFFLSFTLLQ